MGVSTEELLVENEAAFYAEASRLRQKYASQIKLVIGFEIDWIRPESLKLIEASLSRLPFEFFVGSVHHVHTIPIDYDASMYQQALDAAGGTDERLFEDYYDSQLDMLQKLKPPVVGHFDLIRLKSGDPNAASTRYPNVWDKIQRNLRFVAGYGGLLELNSAALRKGMTEPYPKADICRVSREVSTCQVYVSSLTALFYPFYTGIPVHGWPLLHIRRQPWHRSSRLHK